MAWTTTWSDGRRGIRDIGFSVDMGATAFEARWKMVYLVVVILQYIVCAKIVKRKILYNVVITTCLPDEMKAYFYTYEV
jgi:hypothetical protein